MRLRVDLRVRVRTCSWNSLWISDGGAAHNLTVMVLVHREARGVVTRTRTRNYCGSGALQGAKGSVLVGVRTSVDIHDNIADVNGV